MLGEIHVKKRKPSLLACGVALPSLIPDVMPPPPSPDEQNPWHSTLPTNSPRASALGTDYSSQYASDLETYLASQVHMKDSFSPEDCCAGLPEWGQEWSSFVRGFKY